MRGTAYRVLFAFLIGCVFPVFGQEEEEKPVENEKEAVDTLIHRSNFRAYAALLINRSNSNISDKTEQIDDFSVIQRMKSDSAPRVRPGFAIGIESLLGKKEGLKGVLDLSFAYSSAQYRYVFTEEGNTSREGFSHMKRITDLDNKETYFYLNIGAGARSRFAEGWYLGYMLFLNKPLSATRSSRGTIQTTYSNPGSPDTEETIAHIDQPKANVKGEANLSFRLKLEYEFEFNDKPAGVFLYRNFGMIYTLPWWGLGVSISL